MAKSAIDALRKDLKGKSTDRFRVGDVIRWTGGGRYTYAAIKTSIGWFTTARGINGNGIVAKVYDYEELVDMLAKGDATDIEVAVEWEAIDEDPVPDPTLRLAKVDKIAAEMLQVFKQHPDTPLSRRDLEALLPLEGVSPSTMQRALYCLYPDYIRMDGEGRSRTYTMPTPV